MEGALTIPHPRHPETSRNWSHVSCVPTESIHRRIHDDINNRRARPSRSSIRILIRSRTLGGDRVYWMAPPPNVVRNGPRGRVLWPILIVVPRDIIVIVAPFVYIFEYVIVPLTQYEDRHFRMGIIRIPSRCEVGIRDVFAFVAPYLLPPFAIVSGGYVLRVRAYAGYCS